MEFSTSKKPKNYNIMIQLIPLRNQKCKIALILCILGLFISVTAVELPYIKKSGATVTSIRLFDDFQLTKSDKIDLNNYSFKKSQTARISWEILFSYKKFSRVCELPITAVFHKSDSTVVGRNEYLEEIEKDWEWSTCGGSWGWDVKSNWVPGNYFIEFYAGDVYLGRIDFEIVNDEHLPYIESIDAYVKNIHIYEQSSQPEDNEKLRYKSVFFLSNMRKVAWQIELEHDAFSTEIEMPLSISLCRSDDTVVKRFEQNKKFKKGFENTWFNGTWGWNEVGPWNPGKYYLDLYSGEVHLGRKEFEIINDLELYYIESLDAYVESLKLFSMQELLETDEPPPYRTSFKQQYLKDIGWYLTLRHMVSKDCDFEIVSKFFDSKGRELSNQVTPTMMRTDWYTSKSIGDWGVPILGRWKQGIYRVELYIGDELIATTPFEIVQ